MSLINNNVMSLLAGDSYRSNTMKAYASINSQTIEESAEALSNGFVSENTENPDDESVSNFIIQSAKNHIKDACGIE